MQVLRLFFYTLLLNSLSYKITGMTQPTPRSSVLIVDDLPNNVRLLSIMLTEKGYQVRKAINGQMALNTVRSLIPDLTSSILICPISMVIKFVNS